MWCVATCRGTVAANDIWVVPDQRGPTIIIGEIYGPGVCVSSLDHQPARELAVDGNLKRVVIGTEKALPEIGFRGAPKENVEGLAGLARPR